MSDEEKTVRSLLSIQGFPPHIIAVFIQNASKILSKLASHSNDSHFTSFCGEVEQLLTPFLNNQHLEIQERATSLLQIISIFTSRKEEGKQENDTFMDCVETLSEPVEQADKPEEDKIDFESIFYAYALNPVAAKAQRKVPIPPGLDLDLEFVNDGSDDEDDGEDDHDHGIHLFQEEQVSSDEVDEVQIHQNHIQRESRRFEQENNPHYLKVSSSKKHNKKPVDNAIIDFDDGEKADEALESLSSEHSSTSTPVGNRKSIPGLVSSENFLLNMKSSSKKASSKSSKSKSKKSKKKSKQEEIEEEEEDENTPQFAIRALEMPEGADLNDDDEDSDGKENDKDPHKALGQVSLDDVLHFIQQSPVPKNLLKVTKTKKSKKDTTTKITEDDKNGVEKKKVKKSSKKSATQALVTELITTEPFEKVKTKKTKTSKSSKSSSQQANDNGAETLVTKSSKSSKKKSKDSKNRAEYEETFGMESVSIQQST